MRLGQLQLFYLLKQTALKWNEHNCLRLGASLSYYTLFSLFPLILVVLSIVRLLLVNSDAARDAILAGLSSVTGGFRDEFVAALEAAIQTRRASGIIGTITLLLGATWVFGELASAFNIIWGVEEPAGGGPMEFLRRTLFSLALVLAMAFLLLVGMIVNAATTALGAFAQALPGGFVVHGIAQFAINFVVLTLIFAALFKYLPSTPVAWGDVWLGAALTSVSWNLLQLAISYYIALSSYKNYGAVGSILALVAWVYLSSQVLFFGGEFTNVYAQTHGSRAVVPAGTAAATSREASTRPPEMKELASTSESSRYVRIAAAAMGITIGVLATVVASMAALLVGVAQVLMRIRKQ